MPGGFVGRLGLKGALGTYLLSPQLYHPGFIAATPLGLLAAHGEIPKEKRLVPAARHQATHQRYEHSKHATEDKA